MSRKHVTIVAAVAILSLGSLVAERAQAGASASAPSKPSHAMTTASLHQVRNHKPSQTADVAIEEFTSSSAKTTSVPKR
jgi:hypothetical protein